MHTTNQLISRKNRGGAPECPYSTGFYHQKPGTHEQRKWMVTLWMVATLILPQTAHSTDAPLQTSSPKFVSNLVIGASQTKLWYRGFESVVEDDQWELLSRWNSSVRQWADSNYIGWSQRPHSPTAVRSGDPDRVVFVMSCDLNGDGDIATCAEQLWKAVHTIRRKYVNVKQIVLQPSVGGPNGGICLRPSGNVAVMASEANSVTISAINYVVYADKSGTVFAGPAPRIRQCSDYSDHIGHFSPAVAWRIGRVIGTYYANPES